MSLQSDAAERPLHLTPTLEPTAHAPRAGYRQALLPGPSHLDPRSNAMLDFIVRFLEELLDIANFGNDVSK